jgi:hypothetical protein
MSKSNANATELNLLDCHNLVRDFYSEYSHDCEPSDDETQDFLTKLELGLNSKNEAIELFCRKMQYRFVDNIE